MSPEIRKGPECYSINRVAATYAWCMALSPAFFSLVLACFRERAWRYGEYELLAAILATVGVGLLILAFIKSSALINCLTEVQGRDIPKDLVSRLIRNVTSLSYGLILILVGTLNHHDLSLFWLAFAVFAVVFLRTLKVLCSFKS